MVLTQNWFYVSTYVSINHLIKCILISNFICIESEINVLFVLNLRFIHLDASSILANHQLPAPESDTQSVVTVLSSTVGTSQPIPQTLLSELSPQQSLQQLIAHNTYNITNQLSPEVNPQNNSRKTISNTSIIRPQLVPFNLTKSLSSSSPPTQPSIPSLITDSRQSSEDSGYSEPTPNSKQTSQSSAGSQSHGSCGGKTYAQMASNKDSSNRSVPNVVTNVRTNVVVDSGCGVGSSASVARTALSKTLCPYAVTSIDGICPYPEGSCVYTHGQICDLCGRACLDPSDVDQQNKHRDVSNQSIILYFC